LHAASKTTKAWSFTGFLAFPSVETVLFQLFSHPKNRSESLRWPQIILQTTPMVTVFEVTAGQPILRSDFGF
jgi:hypothetical protein